MAGMGKTYQITVRGTRSVESVVTQEYLVTAGNQGEAETTARNDYNNEYPGVDADVTEVSILKRKWNKWNIVAIACLSIPLLFSFVHWDGPKKDPPLLISGTTMLMAIIIYSAFIIRVKIRSGGKGLLELFKSPSDVMLMIMTLFFCASFLKVFLNDITIPVKFLGLIKVTEITFSGTKLFLIAALLSWLSIPAVAGVIWALLFLVAINNVISIFNAMAFPGAVYVLSAFFGIIFQLGQESSYFLKSLRGDIVGAGAISAQRIKGDMAESANFAKRTAKKLVTAATGVPVNSSTNKTGTSTDVTNARQ